jgi:hypothetical protein
MTPPTSEQVAVHRTFLLVFIVLALPPRYFALEHDVNVWRVVGATLSIVLVWWCLYRLSMRATRPAWFTAISIPALYIATWAPIYGWITVVVLLAVHVFLGRYFPPPDPVEQPDHQSQVADGASEAVAGADSTGTGTPYDIVDLDSICTPYRRILFALRIIRAATATAANSALLIGPVMLSFALYDGESTVSGVRGSITAGSPLRSSLPDRVAREASCQTISAESS